MSNSFLPEIEKAINFSSYLARIINKNEQLKYSLEDIIDKKLTENYFQKFTCWENLDEIELKKQLRYLRQLVFAQLMIRDLSHKAHLEEITLVISLFADFAINMALNFAQKFYQTRYGEAIGAFSHAPQRLSVIGMGKLGGYELNVSSDIDLIFTYPESGETNGKKSISNQEFFTKVGQKLIKILNETTEEGQVFRVDMRLRPHGDSGPLVTSETALEQYLITQGREWERYAWIKARVVTHSNNSIYDLLRPFVYRKYLDFNAYDAMRRLHQQIKQEVARKQIKNNIKLGSGGIREAEFIVQIFQLIWGGKNKKLQLKGTQTAAEALADADYLSHEDKNELLMAYRFLRNLEHRIQYLDDQQTHTLPENSVSQDKIAFSMGYTDYASFLGALSIQQNKIKTLFEQLLSSSETEQEGDEFLSIWQQNDLDSEIVNKLNELGFSVYATYAKLSALKNSPKYKKLSNHSQSLLDKLIPLLIKTSSQSSKPDLTLSRFLDFLETISRRSSYLAFLTEHPETLTPLANIFAASTWVSNYMMRHPALLDELLNARLMYEKPDWEILTEQLDQELLQAKDDVETKIDILRHFQHAQIFRLAVQDISNQWVVEELSDQLTFLADTIIKIAFKHVWLMLKNKHCEFPKVAVIGYGKLGGKELAYSSDLDLVFLYQDDDPATVETYSRFIRRLNTWLSSNTGAGDLYTIDLRLRPNGDAGLLLSSFEAFTKYQHTHAWVWEHQALTRARFICGDGSLKEQFNALRYEILTSRKDNKLIKSEILKMRERIEQTHPAHETDVKYARGGIVDVEFIVQHLVLTHANKYPNLTKNYGNIALLGMVAEFNLIPPLLAGQCQVAYRYYRQIQHNINLLDTSIATADEQLTFHYTCVMKLWKVIFNQKS